MVKAKRKAATVASSEPTSAEAITEEKVEEKKDVEEKPKEKNDPAAVMQGIKDQARVAVTSLKQYVSAREDKSLFPEMDHGLELLVIYKKPALANGPTQKKRIILPHPSADASSVSFCLIMPDLDTSMKARTNPDVDKEAREWAERLQTEHEIMKEHVAKVITKRQLEREYHTNRDKRKLATAFDLFLVEKTVHKSVHSFLGKEFIRAHKMPLTFDYTKPLAYTLKKSVATTIYDITALKTRVSIRCGHLGQPLADLTANVEAVLSGVAESCPGGVANLRSLSLQQSSSKPSLPIYLDESPANDILMLKKKPQLHENDIVDELSTLPDGLKVAVSRSGRVKVLSEETLKTVIYPTKKDEWQLKDDLKPKVDLEMLAKKRKNKKIRKEKRRAVIEKKKAKAAQVKDVKDGFDAAVKTASAKKKRPLLESFASETPAKKKKAVTSK